MSNASDGARIKIWPGVPPNTTGSEVGGGEGWVRNVTYEKFHNENNDCKDDRGPEIHSYHYPVFLPSVG